MSLLHALLLGFFILIALYLGTKNAGGVAQIFNAGGPQVVKITEALQGR